MTKAFDLNSYYDRLKTRQLGRPCIYLECTESTIEASASEKPGTIVLAGQQTKGRGQRTNLWHSPNGCAMASLRFACAKSSYLAKRFSFLQHIVALAVVKALEQIHPEKLGPNFIRLKWPNDLIYVDSKENNCQKIGGILIHSAQKGDILDATLSFGLNVFNNQPTTCVSEILNSKDGYSVETIVADTINHLEEYTDNLDESNFQELRGKYIDRCLQINKLITDERHGRVSVKDVDNDGFLVGERYQDSTTCIITKIVS